MARTWGCRWCFHKSDDDDDEDKDEDEDENEDEDEDKRELFRLPAS
jgi:hypothetical protein